MARVTHIQTGKSNEKHEGKEVISEKGGGERLKSFFLAFFWAGWKWRIWKVVIGQWTKRAISLLSRMIWFSSLLLQSISPKEKKEKEAVRIFIDKKINHILGFGKIKQANIKDPGYPAEINKRNRARRFQINISFLCSFVSIFFRNKSRYYIFKLFNENLVSTFFFTVLLVSFLDYTYKISAARCFARSSASLLFWVLRIHLISLLWQFKSNFKYLLMLGGVS